LVESGRKRQPSGIFSSYRLAIDIKPFVI